MKFKKHDTGQSGSQSNLFLRIKDGEVVTGILRGEVYEFCSKWIAGKSILVDERDPDGRTRFRVNLVIYEDGVFVPKIWEFGVAINNKLAEIADLLSDVDRNITETKIKIARHGSELKTEYTIQPLAKEPLSKSQLESINAVKLNLLEHQEKKKDDLAPPSYLDEPPIDDDLGF